MADLGVREVTVIGGEAYLREDWTEIIRAIRARGMTCTMTTGGRGLDAARVAAAKEAGLQSVSVSVDGLEATHDMLRGVSGSYRSAMDAIGNLRAARIPVACNTQIGRQSLHEIEALFDLLVAAGIHSWQIQLTVAMGRAADEPALLLEPWQVLEVMPMVARCHEKALPPRWHLAGNNIGYFGPTRACCAAAAAWAHGLLRRRTPTWASRPTATSRDALAAPPTTWPATSAMLRCVTSGSAERRCASPATAPSRTCGGTAATATTPTPAAPAALDQPRPLGRPGNNPFCHHAPSSCCARASASGW